MNIRRLIVLLFVCCFVASCNPGTGCLINQEVHVKPGKDGKLPKSGGGSTSLWSKKTKKKMKW